MVKSFGRKGEGIKADIRDIATLREIADRIKRDYGKIDVVVSSVTACLSPSWVVPGPYPAIS